MSKRFLLIAMLSLLGCRGFAGRDGDDGVQGLDGFPTLVRIDAESPGENCALGGTRVRVGLDRDRSGELEAREIDDTRFVCDGSGGRSLVMTSEVAPECPRGGTTLVWGVDANDDGVLDEAERSGSTTICNGLSGVPGKTGEAGPGMLQVLTPVGPGAGCAAGGYTLTFGRDLNDDGILEPTEIEGTATLCNGVDGRDSLVRQTPLKAGSDPCPNGGVLIHSGVDLNRDGVLDGDEVTDWSAVCVPCAYPRSRNCTSATLLPGEEIQVPFRPGSLDIGDLNGDGVLDLVSRSDTGPQIYAAFGRGDGTFGEFVQVASGSGAVRIADLDADSVPDVVACGSSVTVFLGKGDGTFGPAIAGPSVGTCLSQEPVDFNGDGLLDLAVLGRTGLRLWKGQGDGTFSDRVMFDGPSVSATIGAISSADLDGDGSPDLAWVTSDLELLAGTLVIAWNDGNGGARTFSRLNAPSAAGRLGLGKLDGDPFPDVLVASPPSLLGAKKFEARLADGSGQVGGALTAATYGGQEPNDFALADFDGDGRLDAVAAENGGSVSIYVGKGDGTLRSRANTVAAPSDFLRVADFDGDGKIDVVVAGRLAQKITILFGN